MKEAIYTAVWDNQFETVSACLINEETHEVFPQEILQDEKAEIEEELGIHLQKITQEYVTISGTDCFLVNGRYIPPAEFEYEIEI